MKLRTDLFPTMAEEQALLPQIRCWYLVGKDLAHTMAEEQTLLLQFRCWWNRFCYYNGRGRGTDPFATIPMLEGIDLVPTMAEVEKHTLLLQFRFW